MQTFLPYSDFTESAKCLDYRRLGKQRVEAKQILNALESTGKRGWINHPCAKQWRGHEDALRLYANVCIAEWVRRGYKNTMPLYYVPDNVHMPAWLGNESYHSSHRAALLAKNFEFYSRYDWAEQPAINYVWPSKNEEGNQQ